MKHAFFARCAGLLGALALGITPGTGQDRTESEALADGALLLTTPRDAAPPPSRETQTYREHLYFLANPFLEGRGPGTRGNEMAAEYVESSLRAVHLRQSFLDEAHSVHRYSFRQPFTAGNRSHSSGTTIVDLDAIRERGSQRPPEPVAEHVALGFSADGYASGPLVFVGYGIQGGGPDKSYNTFAEGDDLSGKVAVLFRFEPMTSDGKSRWRKSSDGLWTSSASLTSKVQEVLKRKPAALLLVNPPGADDPRAKKLETTEGSARWMPPIDVPVLMLTAEGGDRLVAWADKSKSLRQLREHADERGGTVPLGTKPVGVTVHLDRSARTTWNIAATLPGSGNLADQFIILGAHYDHVGYGYTGGSRMDDYGVVHPGADDNASGTAGLLLAAEILKKRYDEAARLGEPGHQQPRRSIMFVAFSAEEMGLIGSREFIKNCPVSASSIAAMLNMDMIGRLRDNKLEISGTGTADGLADLLKPLFDASGLAIKASPGGRGPSDHATFYGAQIPVLAFFTGLHEEYHTPRDTVDLVNIDGAVKVVHLVCDIAQALAARTEPLVFTSTDKAAIGALSPPGDPDAPAVSMGSVKVRFGIAPGNYADDQTGVLVGEVYPGTCAAEAGVQPNDRLIRWGGEPIGDVAHWMGYLAKHQPGDVVDVTIIRGGEEQTVKVTLKSRDQAPR